MSITAVRPGDAVHVLWTDGKFYQARYEGPSKSQGGALVVIMADGRKERISKENVFAVNRTTTGQGSDFFVGEQVSVRTENGALRSAQIVGDPRAPRILVRLSNGTFLNVPPEALHRLAIPTPPPSLPPGVVERIVERQILVARCKFCQAITPADLSDCQGCGARSFF